MKTTFAGVTKEEFVNDVTNELLSLRTNLTDEQKSKLDYDNFHPGSSDDCIYGQLTGDCTSDEANAMRELKYSGVFNNENAPQITISNKKEDGLGSALEIYLYVIADTISRWFFGIHVPKNEIHEQIFQYIKGERDTFVVSLD